MNAKVLSDL